MHVILSFGVKVGPGLFSKPSYLSIQNFQITAYYPNKKLVGDESMHNHGLLSKQ